MRKLRLLLSAGLIGVAVLGGVEVTFNPSVAYAKSGYSIHPAESWKTFHVRGKNGYQILVSIEGRRVSLEAVSPVSTAKYSVPAKIGNGLITARFGRLGSVSMEFVPTLEFTPTNEPQGDCRGRRAEVRPGTFRGFFRWRGENGFSSAVARRVFGLSVRTYREVCKGETAAYGRDEAERPVLRARSSGGREVREVAAYDSTEGGTALVARVLTKGASLFSERTVVSVVKEAVQVDADGNQIITGSHLYRGFVELRANPSDTERWRGSLEANFPGRGYVRLAGEDFEVELTPPP